MHHDKHTSDTRSFRTPIPVDASGELTAIEVSAGPMRGLLITNARGGVVFVPDLTVETLLKPAKHEETALMVAGLLHRLEQLDVGGLAPGEGTLEQRLEAAMTELEGYLGDVKPDLAGWAADLKDLEVKLTEISRTACEVLYDGEIPEDEVHPSRAVGHVDRLAGALRSYHGVRADFMAAVDSEQATRKVLEEAMGRTPDPARSTAQVARDLIAMLTAIAAGPVVDGGALTEDDKADEDDFTVADFETAQRRVAELTAEVERLRKRENLADFIIGTAHPGIAALGKIADELGAAVAGLDIARAHVAEVAGEGSGRALAELDAVRKLLDVRLLTASEAADADFIRRAGEAAPRGLTLAQIEAIPGVTRVVNAAPGHLRVMLDVGDTLERVADIRDRLRGSLPETVTLVVQREPGRPPSDMFIWRGDDKVVGETGERSEVWLWGHDKRDPEGEVGSEREAVDATWVAELARQAAEGTEGEP